MQGYQFSNGRDRATLACNTLSENWKPNPGDVGLCERKSDEPPLKRWSIRDCLLFSAIIETHENCQYWFSGIEKRSENDAKNHCKAVLGENASLAIVRNTSWISSSQLPRLVGAYMERRGYWNDGVRIKGICKGGSQSKCFKTGLYMLSLLLRVHCLDVSNIPSSG